MKNGGTLNSSHAALSLHCVLEKLRISRYAMWHNEKVKFHFLYFGQFNSLIFFIYAELSRDGRILRGYASTNEDCGAGSCGVHHLTVSWVRPNEPASI